MGVIRHLREPVTKARHLRKQSTDAEKLLWSNLRSHQMFGFQFRRQEPIGRYIVDFVCYRRRLIIELDGGHHQEQAGYDSERTDWLSQRGFKVIRFWNDDVVDNIDGVLDAIYLALQERG